jgi:uncharacterized membrane protein YhaH (DUF805 family)
MSLQTADLVPLLRHLAHPAGRCDRQGFFVVAVGLIALQILAALVFWALGLRLDGAAFLLINAPLIWAGSMAAIKRLHDVGLPAWWIPLAFTGWVAGSLAINLTIALGVGPSVMAAAVADKTALYWVVFAVTALPALGGLLWLHAAPGAAGDNRFGAPPDATGFSPVRDADEVVSAALPA